MNGLTYAVKIRTSRLSRKRNRLAVWQKARGLWKSKKPDPIVVLERMRRDWWFSMFTLDTNAIIYYLKGDERIAETIEEVISSGASLYISVITELELFSFSRSSANELRIIESLLATLIIIPLDSHLARLAGNLRRNYHLKTPDSIIASTAIFTGTKLLTRNTRDFKRIINLMIQAV